MPKSDRLELTRRVKAEARRLGFDLVGVTTPGPPPHLDVYQRWLEQGRHGAMRYLGSQRARERRADPMKILPECRSILVVGINYLTQPAQQSQADPKQEFRVAAYALGDDYHETLPPRLEKLVQYAQDQVGEPFPYKIYTDTGPILERELAQRSGLGWIGKNTCLINPDRGSYFLLAEAFLGIELEPDAPFDFDRCGQCTRCIEACPTNCILPDRTLDARRCISYLTIELKEDIPVDLRQQVGQWLFGCDICQQVCPWNERFAEPSGDKSFQPSAWLKQAVLEDFILLEQSNWRAGLKGSPLERPRRKGLVRNACIVAGNAADPALTPRLVHQLQNDPEPMARRHAAWALGRIRGQAVKQVLKEAASRESDASVQAAIQDAIQSLPQS
jgi:epoxyqueuosine reductase